MNRLQGSFRDYASYVCAVACVGLVREYFKIWEVPRQSVWRHKICRIEAGLHAYVPVVVSGINDQTSGFEAVPDWPHKPWIKKVKYQNKIVQTCRKHAIVQVQNRALHVKVAPIRLLLQFLERHETYINSMNNVFSLCHEKRIASSAASQIEA